MTSVEKPLSHQSVKMRVRRLMRNYSLIKTISRAARILFLQVSLNDVKAFLWIHKTQMMMAITQTIQKEDKTLGPL